MKVYRLTFKSGFVAVIRAANDREAMMIAERDYDTSLAEMLYCGDRGVRQY